jgi:hypothetical protein
MALTRKATKSIIENEDLTTEEKVAKIIEAHTDSVNALKDERDTFKETAERLSGVESELETLKSKGDGGWQKKYEDEHAAFESYKNDISAREQREAKASAYRALLIEAGIDPNRVDTVVRAERERVEALELDENSKIKNAADVTAAAKKDWADLMAKTTVTGVHTANPPYSNGSTGTGKTRDEILAIKDGTVRRQEMAKNPHLFGLESK